MSPFEDSVADDWRRLTAGIAGRSADDAKADEDDDATFTGREHAADDPPLFSRTCCLGCAAALVAVLALGVMQLYVWLNPAPLVLSVDVIRPQKFKVDVTEFFAPRVSAAVQLVLQVSNSNLFRGLILENVKLVAFEKATGLKLTSSVHERPMLVSPRNTVQLTMSLNGLGGALPNAEQRRLASLFLSEKALLLTLVATATSRVNLKGAKGDATPITTNTSRRVDLSALVKEPFFQRAPPPPSVPMEDIVHDVP